MGSNEKLTNSIKKYRDFLEKKQGAPIFQTEMGFFSLDRWIEEGYLRGQTPQEDWYDYHYGYLGGIFGFDVAPMYYTKGLGWTEPELYPYYEEKIIFTDGTHNIVEDFIGRKVKRFSDTTDSYMSEFIEHPVKSIDDFKKNIEMRMNYETSERQAVLKNDLITAKQMQDDGKVIIQMLIGGYMYLRSIIGPTEVMYAMYDDPELIHLCMKKWFELSDNTIAEYQKSVNIDVLFFGEDISYNGGLLISPELIKEFLFPYYQQLINNVKKRQIIKDSTLYIDLDSDGNCNPAIEIYQDLGFLLYSPCEVASGSDVMKIMEKYKEVRLHGGIDKRVLSQNKDSIDKYLEHLIPIIRNNGGYYNTCDHGVPKEVSFENYMHYRKRSVELGCT